MNVSIRGVKKFYLVFGTKAKFWMSRLRDLHKSHKEELLN